MQYIGVRGSGLAGWRAGETPYYLRCSPPTNSFYKGSVDHTVTRPWIFILIKWYSSQATGRATSQIQSSSGSRASCIIITCRADQHAHCQASLNLVVGLKYARHLYISQGCQVTLMHRWVWAPWAWSRQKPTPIPTFLESENQGPSSWVPRVSGMCVLGQDRLHWEKAHEGYFSWIEQEGFRTSLY